MINIFYSQHFMAGMMGMALMSFNLSLARHPTEIGTRSKCHHCNKTLLWFDLIPVLSYILLKGACRLCQKSIPFWIPILEALGGLWVMLAYDQDHPYVWSIMGLLLGGMVAADLERREIPHLYLAGLLILSLVCHGDQSNHWLSFGIMAGLLSLIQGYYYLTQGRIVLGMGDLKLLSLLAFWFEPKDLPLFLFWVGVGGALFGYGWKKHQNQDYFPFAPPIIFVFSLLLWLNNGI